MRRWLAWIAGALGLAALIRRLRRRRQAAATADPWSPPAVDPADELRAALTETEGGVPDQPVEDATQPASLEERRRKVHERAQEALDTMRDPPAGA